MHEHTKTTLILLFTAIILFFTAWMFFLIKEQINITETELRTGYTNIGFSPGTQMIEKGETINRDCFSWNECNFTHRQLDENEQYYTNIMFIGNYKGRRATDVAVEIRCDNMELWGIAKVKSLDFTIERVWVYSKLTFPVVDETSILFWKMIYKITDPEKDIICHLEYVSDQAEPNEVDINLTNM